VQADEAAAVGVAQAQPDREQDRPADDRQQDQYRWGEEAEADPQRDVQCALTAGVAGAAGSTGLDGRGLSPGDRRVS